MLSNGMSNRADREAEAKRQQHKITRLETKGSHGPGRQGERVQRWQFEMAARKKLTGSGGCMCGILSAVPLRGVYPWLLAALHCTALTYMIVAARMFGVGVNAPP